MNGEILNSSVACGIIATAMLPEQEHGQFVHREFMPVRPVLPEEVGAP